MDGFLFWFNRLMGVGVVGWVLEKLGFFTSDHFFCFNSGVALCNFRFSWNLLLSLLCLLAGGG